MPKPSDTTIRAMHPDDLDAVLAVQAACYPPALQEPRAVVLARMQAAGDTCVVAQDAKGVCGYLFAYPSRLGMVTPLGAPFQVASDPDTLYLHDLSVAPHALGQGVARRLVRHLLMQARTRGWERSALVSVQDTAGFWNALDYRVLEVDCATARAALRTYPGAAQYMARSLTGPAVPSPNC